MGQDHVTALLMLTHRMLGHLAIILTGAGVFAAIDFNHTITLGSVLLGAVLLVFAGVITIRSKVATIWREEAEGQRARAGRLEEELEEEKERRAAFDRQQQELRHDLKDELVAYKAQLKAMEAKTDLTVALDAIRDMQQETIKTIAGIVADSFIEQSKKEHAKTHKILGEIRDKLPGEPIEVVDVTPDTHQT